MQDLDENEFSRDYWDCDCEQDYIHLNSQDLCLVCGYTQEESPPSRQSEVKKYKGG